VGSPGSRAAHTPGEPPGAEERAPPAPRADTRPPDTASPPPGERSSEGAGHSPAGGHSPHGDGHSADSTGHSRACECGLRVCARRVLPRLVEHLFTLAAGLAAAIPVIVATVEAVEAGWVPVADRGIIATRAHDVLTSHMPLVGQYTLAGEVTGRVTHSLGPMLFWLLALPAYGGSDVGMTVTMGAVNTLCVVGCVALARRRGGRALMVMTALAIALMCQSLAAETFHDIWNPSAGLFPFTLLIFLCWSVACGEYRLLPLTVVVASFVVQAHLTYLPPTLGLLAIGLGGLAARWIARWRGGTARAWRRGGAARAQEHGGAARGQGHGRASRVRRRSRVVWGLATVLVAGLCWSATIVGQLTEHPGNLTLVAEAASRRERTLSSGVGWHAVVHAVGIVPWWLQTPASRWQRKYEVRSTPSALATDSAIAMLAALALLVLLALLWGRRDVMVLALVGLVLCPALGSVAASTPTSRLLSATLGYTMWWGSQVGMVVWLTLGWALWLALAWTARRTASRAAKVAGRRRARVAPNGGAPPSAIAPSRSARRAGWSSRAGARGVAVGGVMLTLLGVATVAAVGSAVADRGTPDEHAVIYRPIKAIDARLARLIPRGGSVVLEGVLDGATMPAKPAVRYFLVTRGTRVLAPGSYLRLGSWYELYDRPYREAIYLSDVPKLDGSGSMKNAPLIFHVSFREGSMVNTIYVWRSRRPGR
jgi:hypothetical protein